ncbi:AmpG family muropeptide MFS transporter [Luteibacter sp. UNCMF366Tsu5.1]|uniref:AmpG family muropeptide MFS transporter n=1 Tax=Luteibacter sp. UNCMF366Tsu5.1 TaxID=1502758 RepID=UPI0009088D15|nr:MFS transporter [Luteibacter sp. UNCMF366Tsu5.1]SFW67352.1 MFS transporter, PAT family, beta-lactamase induction signal transducer AmpG [Luteibacter sp. UNCMF366Tsu5.1]
MSEPTGAVRYKGLRGVVAAFAQPGAVIMLFFGLASGLPFLLVGNTLSAWLRESGVDYGAIGIASYVTFAYNFKFLWSPAVDRFKLPLFGRLGLRRGWMMFALVLLAAGLLGMAAMPPTASLLRFMAMTLVAALAGATIDIVVDAYRVEIAPQEAQGALAATYTLGYRLGLIAGGAGILLLADALGWQAGYLAICGLLIIPIVAVLVAREPEHRVRERVPLRVAVQEGFVEPFRDFLSRYGLGLALGLLLFVALFRLPDQMLGVMAYPFYQDAGFSKTQIAEVSKVYGVIIGIVGALLGGWAVTRFEMRRLLAISAVGVALSNMLYLIMANHPGQTWAFVATLSGDNFAQGFAGPVLVAFMSGLVNRSFTATQYALLSALANLPGKLLGGFSGFLVKSDGYPSLFVVSTISIVPTLIVLAVLWRRMPVPAHSRTD